VGPELKEHSVKIIHRRDAEFTEIGVFRNQELFTLRTRRLRGESSVVFVNFAPFVVRTIKWMVAR
jgi:hypothetical protein